MSMEIFKNTWVQRESLKHWFKWRGGDLASLFWWQTNPSQVNGLSYFEPTEYEARFNGFAVASRWYEDRVSSFFEEDEFMMELIKDWSVSGEFCFARTPFLRAVRSDFVFPAFNEFDRTKLENVFFIYELPKSPPLSRIIQYNVGKNASIEYQATFANGTIAGIRSPVLKSPIKDVVYFNSGDGFYQDLQPLVREVNVRKMMVSSAHNSSAYPLLQADRLSLSRTGEVLVADQAEALKTGIGRIIRPSFSGESPPKFIERGTRSVTDGLDLIKNELDQISMVSGVPAHLFDLKATSAATDTERLLMAAEARVERFVNAMIRFGFSPIRPYQRPQKVEDGNG